MKKILCFIIFLFTYNVYGQDTFSIIALDTVTGEIGGAGASCIDDSQITGGVVIINDILPGRGGIHTQASYQPANQIHAHERMVEGMSPQEIIDWLVENDIQNNPLIRQYGIVDFDPHGNHRSAAYTGQFCLDYKNHIVGPNYSIQGNILLGQQILDSMETRFLTAEGSLAEKLMAALQGAKVPGADTRCLPDGLSSLSSFIRVAKTSDTLGTYYCELIVPSTVPGVDPIDSLQVLFDQWLNYLGLNQNIHKQITQVNVFPNPFHSATRIEIMHQNPGEIYRLEILDSYGRIIKYEDLQHGSSTLDGNDFHQGIYYYRIVTGQNMTGRGKLVVL
jgi:uncharacterized Ntn-hydrolase superfamily protein